MIRQFKHESAIPDGGGEVEAAFEVRDAAIGGEAAAAAAEDAACATTSISALLMGYNTNYIFELDHVTP